MYESAVQASGPRAAHELRTLLVASCKKDHASLIAHQALCDAPRLLPLPAAARCPAVHHFRLYDLQFNNSA